MEGPDDKFYGFVTCNEWAADPQIVPPADAQGAGLEHLHERSFGELLAACRLGTRDALIEAGRPVYEISLPSLGAPAVGAYLQLWMLTAAQAGLLYGVNAFDQPGVERSKLLTRQYLERG
jgi:glucose-6-phosphate isomerase